MLASTSAEKVRRGRTDPGLCWSFRVDEHYVAIDDTLCVHTGIGEHEFILEVKEWLDEQGIDAEAQYLAFARDPVSEEEAACCFAVFRGDDTKVKNDALYFKLRWC
jgi:hypothetical protein